MNIPASWGPSRHNIEGATSFTRPTGVRALAHKALQQPSSMTAIVPPSPPRDSGHRKAPTETRPGKADEIGVLRRGCSAISSLSSSKPLKKRRYFETGKRRRKSKDRMVGVTGIEPVTPTMSTLLPSLNPAEIREVSTTQQGISGSCCSFVHGSQVQRTYRALRTPALYTLFSWLLFPFPMARRG